MRAMIWAQLRRRPARALALAAGILVAATSFTLLTSVVTSSRAETVGTVNANARSAYDILIRPPRTATPLERRRSLVEANFLSGIFGGITLDQYDRVKALRQIDVAAPIANIGYVPFAGIVKLDVSRFLDSGAPAQVLRLRPTLHSGLSAYRTADQYVYLTRANPIGIVENPGGGYFDLEQERTPKGKYWVCWYYNMDSAGITGREGGPLTRSDSDIRSGFPKTPYAASTRERLSCHSGTDKATADVPVVYPALLSAIDPVQEDRLVGLEDAVVKGRMLRPTDHAYWHQDTVEVDGVNQRDLRLPVILSNHLMTSGQITASVERLDAGDPTRLPERLGSPRAHAFVNGLHGTKVGDTSADITSGFRYDKQALYGAMWSTGVYMTVGPVRYRETEDGLVALTQKAQDPDMWHDGPYSEWLPAPEENAGTQFRGVTGWVSTQCGLEGTCGGEDQGRDETPLFKFVGQYDTSRVRSFGSLSTVPMETYQSPRVSGADDATRAALGGRSLLPDRNLGGYMSQAPTMLTTLQSVQAMTYSRRKPNPQDKAPISAIRVRVLGVTGVDPVSRARVNAAVLAIRRAVPGLDVDVTIGSSPAEQTIVLPGAHRINEWWTSKGVALRILRAVDTKSAVLFVLVLVVCALFLCQAALASVRSRRTEIGTMRCLGWSAREVFTVIAGELLMIGALAGAVGSLLAFGLGTALDLDTSFGRAALVLPVAVALAFVAGSFPAWRATRLGPLDAIRPPVSPSGRARPIRSVLGMALRNLTRMRGRTVLGASGLALAVAAFTVLLSVTLAYNGEVTGSLLGNAVVAQARAADYASVALSLLLGAAGAVDVLVLSQRERAGDLAVLRATGWTSRDFARLTIYEGMGLALLGGLVGSALGVGVVTVLSSDMLGGHALMLVLAGLLGTVAAVALIATALVVPIRALNRIAPAQLLAVE
jgi:putative ABC transport system permease protein